MKIVLMVGYMEYLTREKLFKQYKNIVWLTEESIKNINGAESIVAIVNAIDEVMFTDGYVSSSDRLAYETACVMLKKDVSEVKDYPLTENTDEKGEEE